MAVEANLLDVVIAHGKALCLAVAGRELADLRARFIPVRFIDLLADDIAN